VPDGALALLRRLDRLRVEFGPGVSEQKLALLAALARVEASLPRAGDVLRLHEILCFLRAYPDDEALLSQVDRMLEAFEWRRDLRRHREALVDSGVAGTAIQFRFFQPTASWLARRFGSRMRIDWKRFRGQSLLDRWLPLLALYAETPGLDEYDLPVREWIDRMKGPQESDAAWLARRFDALRIDPFLREKLYDELDVPVRLEPGPAERKQGRESPPTLLRKRASLGRPDPSVPVVGGTTRLQAGARVGEPDLRALVGSGHTPSRTRARHPRSPIVYQTRPLSRSRPVLPDEVFRPPVSVRSVSRSEARALIDLAREAMITRSRDLDVFAWGDARDVRLVDCGGGLVFACIGAIPERRLLLEAVYGFLTLKNGVPIGYVLTSALFGSSEIAYNVFETYRGGESGAVYGRVLAMTRSLFRSDSFTIYPYQLGDENEEAIRSGAWWFYQKIGFTPRDRAARRAMRRELRRMKADPAHRSSLGTLRTLAKSNLFYQVGRPRDDVIGLLPLPEVGLSVTREIARRFGSDREGAAQTCSREAMDLLGLRSLDRFGAGERLAWARWAPLVMTLPGVGRWPLRDRRALAEVIRAKGGRRESDFVALFDRHGRLRRAVRRLAESEE